MGSFCGADQSKTDQVGDVSSARHADPVVEPAQRVADGARAYAEVAGNFCISLSSKHPLANLHRSGAHLCGRGDFRCTCCGSDVVVFFLNAPAKCEDIMHARKLPRKHAQRLSTNPDTLPTMPDVSCHRLTAVPSIGCAARSTGPCAYSTSSRYRICALMWNRPRSNWWSLNS